MADQISNQEHVAAFEKAATAWAQALDDGDARTANRLFSEFVRIYEAITEHGERDVGGLAPLLDSKSDGVALAAASVLLEWLPDDASKALNRVSNSQSLIGLSASMTLREWRAGRIQRLR